MVKLDGKSLAELREGELKSRISKFRATWGPAPGLAVVLVGDNPASHVYVKNKELACERVGIVSQRFDLPTNTAKSALDSLLQSLNKDPTVHGILVQSPLPSGLSFDDALKVTSASKDVDGLTVENLGLLWAGQKRVAPCTPQGVMVLLEHYKISVAGKRAVVVGRSNIVGKPMAQLLLDANATVTICHSKTSDIASYTRDADIVVVAAGKAQFMNKSFFKKGAVVVDVGMHRLPNGKLCGDVDPLDLDDWVSARTPVPGGVGPMTISLLLENTLKLAELQMKKGHK